MPSSATLRASIASGRCVSQLWMLEPDRPAVPGHREVGRVDLQVEARVGDRLVLVAQRLAERLEVLLVGAVVVVGEVEGDLPGADRAHERLVGRRVAERALEALDVAADRVRVLDRHLVDAVGEHEVRHRRRVEQAHREVRVVGDVVGLELRAALEAREAVVDVVAEAGLAQLAVAHDVDAGLALLGHDLGHGAVEALVELGLVGRPLLLDAGPDDLDHVLGTGQAAGVGRDDAVGAPGHGRDGI